MVVTEVIFFVIVFTRGTLENRLYAVESITIPSLAMTSLCHQKLNIMGKVKLCLKSQQPYDMFFLY